MRQKLRGCMWALGLWGVLSGGAVQAASEGALPAFVNWSSDGAYQQDNGLRGSICLNGWWRWQMAGTNSIAAETDVLGEKDPKAEAPPADGWAYRKVPAVGSNFDILDAAGNSILSNKVNEALRKITTSACWVEREFTVPAAWKDKEVQLVFEGVWGDGEIYLDGKKMGYTWVSRWYHLDVPRPYRLNAPYRLSVKSGGVIGNVWLKACPSATAKIEDSYLTTSVRNMAATIRASGLGKAGSQVKVIVADYKDAAKVVKTAGPFPVTVEKDGWRLEQAFEWKDAILWNLTRPHLYNYHLELLDDKGVVVDRIFPLRFGFREIWIQGGYFMLNSRRITLNMDIHTPLGTGPGYGGGWRNAGQDARDDVWRKAIGLWKNLGINTAVHRWGADVDDDLIFRVADEEGFCILMEVRGMQHGSPEELAIPAISKALEDANRYLLIPHRHSPSLALYCTYGNQNCWDYEPGKLGEDYDTEKLFGRHIRPERETITRLDPARIFYAPGGGLTEPVHSSMNYIHIDLDLQAHETWPSYWYTKQKKPLATYEMSEPPFFSDWYMRRSRGEPAHGTPGAMPFFMEVAAIYFGEEPYLGESRQTIEKWLANVEAKKGASLGEAKGYQKADELFSRNVYRAWRTYGANMGFFCQVRGFHKGPALPVEPLKVDPRRTGFTPDKRLNLDPIWDEPLTPVGEVAKAAMSPLLMYIGGPGGKFPLKDRAFYAQETVRKAVVTLNDRDDPATVSGAWELCDSSGKAVLQGALPETKLAPGELSPAKIQIEFKAPAVKERTEFTLKLRGKADAAGSLTDEFALAVFPPPAPPVLASGITIFLYDPVGAPQAMLDKAGVKYTILGGTLPDPENSLVIIGRNALKDKASHDAFAKLIYTKMGYALNVNVSNGMRILVFEQALDNLWGLKTEQTRWRRAFIRAAGHPALAGLKEADFLYLKGESNLGESYPEAPPASRNRPCTDRNTEWGNDNVVTTYALIKPQLGAMRALIDCGFDLQEAALLEAAGGKGRLMFCQVDVSSRYGVDPVSTLLVNNLLAYMTTAAPPDPALGSPVDLVRLGTEDYDNVQVKEAKRVFMADKPEGPISWGISAADLYFEGFLDLPLIQGEGGKQYLYSFLPAGKKIGHTLNRKNFKTNWQKMKAMHMQAALQINQGGSSEIFPTPALQGNSEELYPLEWMEGFVHPYLIMQW